MTLLEVRELRARYLSGPGGAPAVDGVSLSIEPGEIVGVVGESGCGKSTVTRSIMRMHDPRMLATEGEIIFEGTDLMRLSNRAMNRVRGAKISLISQNPQSALNPVITIGAQIAESLMTHTNIGRKQALMRAEGLLERVGIPDAHRRLRSFPHQMSGGQLQRVAIAMALACGPKLLLADEPTTALDVTIQAQVLELLRDLSRSEGMAIMLISHNLAVISQMCSRAHVMYAGVFVESGDSREIFRSPRHPYTQALLRAMPSVDAQQQVLESISGTVPRLSTPVTQCRFADRCEHVTALCRTQEPPLESTPSASVRCFLPQPTVHAHRESNYA